MKNQNKNIFFVDYGEKIIFLFSQKKGNKADLKISESENGFNFSLLKQEIIFKKTEKTSENLDKSENFNIAKTKNHYFLHYEKIVGKLKNKKIYGAVSPDLVNWKVLGVLKGLDNAGSIVPDFFYDNDQVMYLVHDNKIKIAYSQDLLKWTMLSKNILEPRSDKFDNNIINPANVFVRNREIILFYYHKDKNNQYSIGFAVINYDNPEKVIYRCDEAVWTQNKDYKLKPIGITEINGRLASYWEKENGDIFLVFLPSIIYYNQQEISFFKNNNWQKLIIRLEKQDKNPIISPIRCNHWESLAAFNPTAFEYEDKVHILYRAMSHDAISSVGYAVSLDGIHINKRYNRPIYVPRESFEGVNGVVFDYNKTPRYMSGGGWGGCEDARATVINDRLYILYAAFDGYSEPNVAISSISLEDFKKEKWEKWTKPVLITNSLLSTKNPQATEWTRLDRPKAKHTGEKDASVLPEKINGKYVIFHRIWPNIVLDFVDDLEFDGKTFLRGDYLIKIRPQMWDSAKICLAATPVKTKDGWLLIYNAVDKKDPSKYKIGAMLLDLADPRKVLYRCSHPILEPEKCYENNGLKHGIVFACGAIIRNGVLFVYYGGSDEHSCVATYDLEDFLFKLKIDSTCEERDLNIF